jgi:tetratricopeptide (TPR) repeat protein
MPTRISLCMIVKNESAALPAALAAARPWVDEMVVVDTGSTDGTQDIARAHGALVVEWAWRDDFAAARNESLRHATGDWILVLDADEVLTEGSGPALRSACETAGPEVVGFNIKIVCPREGDGGLVRLNWFPRLFRNLPGVRFEGVIHEQVIGSLAGRGTVLNSAVEALHSGYTLTQEQMVAKARRNVALLERQLRDEPDYAPGWFQIAETYVLLDRLDDAIAAYRRCLRVLDLGRLTLPPGVVAVALQNLGATLLARGEREEGMRQLRAALALQPDLPPAHVHLGNRALADGDWEAAERHFADALAAAERAGNHGEYQVSPWLIHFLHGCARARQQKFAAAVASFDAALALNPRHAESLWLLALTAGHAGRWDRTLDALDRLATLGRDDFPTRAQRAQALAALNRHAEAAEAAWRALDLDPGSVPVLALAAESLTRAGRYAEAAEAYERLAALTPDAPAALLALAHCRERAGDPDGMMRAYERAVALAPDSPDVLFALGSACLRGGALETAEECLAGAVAAAPDRPEYRVNHALCRLRRGAVDDARRLLQDIVARWPRVAPARDLLELAERLAASTSGAS